MGATGVGPWCSGASNGPNGRSLTAASMRLRSEGGSARPVAHAIEFKRGGRDRIRGAVHCERTGLSLLTRSFPRTFLVAAFRPPQVPSSSISFPLDKVT